MIMIEIYEFETYLHLNRFERFRSVKANKAFTLLTLVYKGVVLFDFNKL